MFIRLPRKCVLVNYFDSLQPGGSQILNQLPLFVIELFRNLDLNPDEQIPFFAALHGRQAVTGQTHLGSVSGPGRYFEAHLFVIYGGNGYRGPQDGLGQLQLAIQVKIVFLNTELGVPENLGLNVKIAGRAAIWTGISLSGEAQFFAGRQARRNFDG